jgi:ATP-dependent Clp protease ATP-binding subunit ClpB
VKTGLNQALDLSARHPDALNFETSLRRKIVGQDDVLTMLSDMYEVFLAGFPAKGKPIANVLMLGPTGSGKTRTVEVVAEALFGDSRAVIRIDCAEFQHSHEIAKLIGSPPGYLGHRETHPLLTQEALNQWHTDKIKLSLVLFDEIEKANDALWQLLLGIMDKASLTLGDNRRVDFSNVILFFTSNLGAQEMAELVGRKLGLAPAQTKVDDHTKLEQVAVDAARRKFTPEFMNRIDKVVVFHRLLEEHLKQILEIELGIVQQRILQAAGNNQFVFSLTEDAKSALLKEGFDARYNARHLKRAIETWLVQPLARLVANGSVKLGDYIRVSIDSTGRRFNFIKEAEGALVPVLLEKYGPNAEKAKEATVGGFEPPPASMKELMTRNRRRREG